jgi:CubicO group peptidase (beta-lactamase class C family)
MKKILKVFSYSLLTLLLTGVVLFIIFYAPIMAGMAAKTMCSCVYVTGRTPESVVREEFDVFPGLSKASITFTDDSTVTASILFRSKKAIYRKGVGCVLLAEADENTVRSQNIITAGPAPYDPDTVAWPMGDVLAPPTDYGINQELLLKAVDGAFADADPENPIFTHAVVVVHNGDIVAEKYAEGFDKNSRLMGWSMTKSITNALMGILVHDEKISLNDFAPIGSWQSDDRKNIRIEHLMQATSGLTWEEDYFNPFGDFHQMFIYSDDKGGFATSKKLAYQPGEHFQYSSGSTNILSRIIRLTLGDSLYYRFPYERLFYKTGMLHAIMEPDASGTFVGSSYSYASARDWARFGLLYLNDGFSNGERILPEGWVEFSTTPSKAALKQEYGAQIWLNYGERGNPANVEYPGLPNEAIIFDGFEKNFVVIIPSKDLVIVRLGVTHNSNFSLANLVNGVIASLPKESE